MPDRGRICIVLLAAGEAARFGSAKQLLSIYGVAMVRRCTLAALAVVADVVVVTGAHRSEVEEQLAGLPVTVAWNPVWKLGMGSSIKHGLRTATAKFPSLEAVMVCLADQPLVAARELSEVLDEHARHPDCIVAAKNNGVVSPPCVFPRRYFADLETLDDARGARTAISRHPSRLATVALPAAAVDIDEPADYDSLLAAGADAAGTR